MIAFIIYSMKQFYLSQIVCTCLLVSILIPFTFLAGCGPQKHARTNIKKDALVYQSDYKNGVAIVSHNGKWDLINKNKKFLTAHSYQKILSPKGEYYAALKKNDLGKERWGVINNQGEVEIEFKYKFFDNHLDHGFAIVSFFEEKDYVNGTSQNLLYNYINERGKKQLNKDYKKIKFLNKAYLGIKNSKYKWALYQIDEEFKTKFKYENIEFLKDQFFAFEINQRKGILDNTGKELVPPKYKSFKFEKGIKAKPYNTISVRNKYDKEITEFEADSAFFLNSDKLILFKNNKALLYSLSGEYLNTQPFSS